MEKLKPILAGIKKHHFWILAALCAVAIMYGWNSAAGKIQQEFKINKNRVDGEFQKVAKLSQRDEFPNDQWIEATKEKGGEVVKRVEAASKKIMARQTAALQWSDLFAEEFKEAVAKGDWNEDVRIHFREIVPDEIQRLREVMGAAKEPGAEGVDWHKENFDWIVTAFDWQLPPSNPTNALVWRNILWGYEVLARIVAATNEDAPDRFNLPVHTVEELAVSGKAPFEPANWNIAGAAALDGKIPAVSVTGYAVVPVRLRVRMDLKYLSRLLAACANADLPFEIQGLRFEAPSRLTEVEKPKPKTTNKPHFGAFGAAKQAAEKKKEDEPEKPQSTVGRGELVELWGNLYIGQETDFEALLKQQQPAGPVASAPAAGAVAASPAGQP